MTTGNVCNLRGKVCNLDCTPQGDSNYLIGKADFSDLLTDFLLLDCASCTTFDNF